MTTATVQIGSARQLDVVDSFDPLVAYAHPVMLSHNNIVYGSLQDVPVGLDPSDPLNSAYWKVLMKGGMQWKGAYTSQVYNQYEAVQYQGGVYIVKEGISVTATETPTVATAKWDVLLEAPSLDGTANTMVIRDGSGTGTELPLSSGILKSDGTAVGTSFVASTPAIANSIILLAGTNTPSTGTQEGMGGAAIKNGVLNTWGYTTSNMYGRTRNTGNAINPQMANAYGGHGYVVSAVSNAYMNAVVDADGGVYVQHSSNSYGTAGSGFNGGGAQDKDPRYQMRKVAIPAGMTGKPVRLYAGGGGSYSHGGLDALFLLSDQGEVASVGYNGYGQLGLGNTTSRNEFTLVNFPEAITEISVGDSRYMHVMFLGTSGHVYFTGYCHSGRKGDSNNATVNTPQRDDANITPPWGSAKVIAIQAKGSSSNGASVVLCDNGNRYASGYNGHGTVGNGSTGATAVWTPDAHSLASSDYVEMRNTANIYGASFAKDTNDDWWGWGTGYSNGSSTGTSSTPVKMESITAGVDNVIVTSNASGYTNTWFAGSDGKVYACGNGGSYSMGNYSTSSFYAPREVALPGNFGTLVDVAVTGYSSNHAHMLLGSNGVLVGSGYNGHGQAGVGHTSHLKTFSELTELN